MELLWLLLIWGSHVAGEVKENGQWHQSNRIYSWAGEEMLSLLGPRTSV